MDAFVDDFIRIGYAETSRTDPLLDGELESGDIPGAIQELDKVSV